MPLLALSIGTYFGRLAVSFVDRRVDPIAAVVEPTLVPTAVLYSDMLAAWFGEASSRSSWLTAH